MTSRNKEKKINIVKDLSAKLSASKTVLVFDYQGLSAVELNLLRQKITAHSNGIKAVKKNLLKIALTESGQSDLAQKEFSGQAAVALIENNPIETIKDINSLSKSLGKFNFLAGYFEGSIIGNNEFIKIASLLSREELIAKSIFLIKSPIHRFIMQTKVNQQKLVLTLKAVALRR
ncbi:MAG: 50S ribosomal protein L10 [bacterium]